MAVVNLIAQIFFITACVSWKLSSFVSLPNLGGQEQKVLVPQIAIKHVLGPKLRVWVGNTAGTGCDRGGRGLPG